MARRARRDVQFDWPEVDQRGPVWSTQLEKHRFRAEEEIATQEVRPE